MQLEQTSATYTGKPQVEDGFTRVANELLEAIISFGFTSRQLNILLSVIRCTYGYNKKSDAVSGWQLAKITNIDRSHISKTLAELISKNVIIKHSTGRQSHGVFVNEISINKHYEQWLTVAKTATVAEIAPLPIHGLTVAELATVTVAELATQPLPKQPTHKDIPKDNKDITKDIDYFCEIDPDTMREWIAVRKKKRAANLSKIVFNAMNREANIANMPLHRAIEICVERGWIAFIAEWYLPKTKNRYEEDDKQRKEYNKNNNDKVRAAILGNKTEIEVSDAR